MNRVVTYVFEITDEKAWRDAGNPLGKEANGLKCAGVSVGDLMAMADAFEEAAPDAYDKASEEHVIKYLNMEAAHDHS